MTTQYHASNGKPPGHSASPVIYQNGTPRHPTAEELADTVEAQWRNDQQQIAKHTQEFLEYEALAQQHGIDDPPAPRLLHDVLIPGPVTTFTNEMVARTGTLPQFAVGAFLVTASACLGRRALIRLPFTPKGLAPNLYMCLIAPSTGWHKSTLLFEIDEIVAAASERTGRRVRLPEDWTAEGMIKYLAALHKAGKESSGLAIDHEVAPLFGSYNLRHMQTKVEFLLKGFDNARYERIRADANLDQIENATTLIPRPCLSLLGMSTPSSMARHLRPESYRDGLMARWIVDLPFPDERPDFGHLAVKDENLDEYFIHIFADLMRLPQQDHSFDYLYWQNWRQNRLEAAHKEGDEFLLAHTERSCTGALKIATSLSALNHVCNPNDIEYGKITQDTLDRAMTISEYYMDSMQRLRDMQDDAKITGGKLQLLIETMRAIANEGILPTHTAIHRHYDRNMPVAQLKEMLAELEERGRLHTEEHEDPYTRKGRPVMRKVKLYILRDERETQLSTK